MSEYKYVVHMVSNYPGTKALSDEITRITPKCVFVRGFRGFGEKRLSKDREVLLFFRNKLIADDFAEKLNSEAGVIDAKEAYEAAYEQVRKASRNLDDLINRHQAALSKARGEGV